MLNKMNNKITHIIVGLFVMTFILFMTERNVYAADNVCARYGSTGDLKGYYSSINEAINEAGDYDTIKLLRDYQESSAAINLSQSSVPANITIDLCGHTILATSSGSGDMVIIPAGKTLTLENNTNDPTKGLIKGTLSSNSIVNNAGTFIMNGGTLSDNHASVGGGVYNTGTFIMNGGKIGGKITYPLTEELIPGIVATTGGGVYNTNTGTFTMNRGSISDIKTNNGGSGVYNEGTFTMNGGSITGNTARDNGGGVYNTNTGTVTIKGGTISGNKAGKAGNGDGIFNSGTVIIKGGTISDENFNNDNGTIIIDIKPDPENPVENGNPIDEDTFKSSLDQNTITLGILGKGLFFDMKAHEMDEATIRNQDFLANLHPAAKGKKIKVISRYDIYPRRALSTTEKGSLINLTWNDLKNTTPGSIYAVCYSQNGGAYFLTGTVDAKGTAIFPNFMVNEATSITVFQVQ